MNVENTMRRSLVVGNWKMHGTKAGVDDLVSGLKNERVVAEQTDFVVCPPYLFIPQVAGALAATDIQCGAQNLSDQLEGAYTGEVSASMLAEMGCQYVIVGHSERRALFAETDELIAAKFAAAQSAGLTPVLCVGESLVQREAEQTLVWIEQQLTAVINVVGVAALASAVIAYEPIWAIGTGETATPAQAQRVHAHIRQVVAGFDQQVAQDLSILYGGSVKANNAVELFAEPDIDGALVGGASLQAVEFIAICKAVA
jgi:triosephosphate isomerase (TIM)